MGPVATLLMLLAASCRREEVQTPALSCLDQQLAKRGLNPYGDPPDTNYAGGTPLFDEKTGKTTDRTTFVLARHPDIAKACAAGR